MNGDELNLAKQNEIEIAKLREENFRLVATVLKNNEDIQLILKQYRAVVSKLEELSEDFRKLEKQNFDLEEKCEMNMDEIKMVCSDVEDLHSVNKFLRKEIIKAKNDNLQITEDLNNERESKSVTDTQRSSCSVQTVDLDEKWGLHTTEPVEKRIDQLERKLNTMTVQNGNICDRLDRCLKQLDHTRFNTFPESNNNTVLKLKLDHIKNNRNHTVEPSMYAEISSAPPLDSPPSIPFVERKFPKQTATVPPMVEPLYPPLPPQPPSNPMLHQHGQYNVLNNVVLEQQIEEAPYHRRHRRHRIRLFGHKRRH